VGAFKSLPDSLLLRLRFEVYWPSLHEHPMFFHMKGDFLCEIKDVCHSGMSEKSLGGGQVLFSEGEKAKSVVFVRSRSLKYKTSSLKTSVGAGRWLCEATLWLQWQCMGRASVCKKIDRQGVSGRVYVALLDSDVFRAVMCRTDSGLSRCMAYARRFAAWAADCESLTDIGPDLEDVELFAAESFPRWTPSTNPVRAMTPVERAVRHGCRRMSFSRHRDADAEVVGD